MPGMVVTASNDHPLTQREYLEAIYCIYCSPAKREACQKKELTPFSRECLIRRTSRQVWWGNYVLMIVGMISTILLALALMGFNVPGT